MILSQLLKDEDNKYCVDCDAKGKWRLLFSDELGHPVSDTFSQDYVIFKTGDVYLALKAYSRILCSRIDIQYQASTKNCMRERSCIHL